MRWAEKSSLTTTSGSAAPSTVSCRATMSGMSAMPSVSSEIFSSTPRRWSSTALRIRSSGASQVRSYRSLISRGQLLGGVDQLLVGRALELVLGDPDHGPAGDQQRHDRDRDREQQELGAKVEPHALPPGRAPNAYFCACCAGGQLAALGVDLDLGGRLAAGEPGAVGDAEPDLVFAGLAVGVQHLLAGPGDAVAQVPGEAQRLAVGIARGRGVEQQLIVGAADEALAIGAGDRDRRRVDVDLGEIGGAGAARAGIVGHRQPRLVGAGLLRSCAPPWRPRPCCRRRSPNCSAPACRPSRPRCCRRRSPPRPGRPAGRGRPSAAAAG